MMSHRFATAPAAAAAGAPGAPLLALPPASTCARTQRVLPAPARLVPGAGYTNTSHVQRLAPVRVAHMTDEWVEEARARAPSAQNAEYKPRTEPTPEILDTWMNADAVCFDVDCTITVNDGLDLLAEFMGVKEQVEDLTNRAMDGSISLEESLEERLKLINCTPDDVKLFNRAHPPQSRLAPGIETLIKALQARGKAIYLISGGFRELILPIAAYLGIPKDNVYANRMNWQWDDETGAPTSLVGFDPAQPTSRNQGKVQAIREIRQRNPYNTVVMIGDGITDLEAVQTTHGADLFIGYGGVVERPSVASEAEWYVYDYSVLVKTLKRLKVAMIGSGAWACATVRMIAQNTCPENDPAMEFADTISMWVHDTEYQGRKISEVMNETNENPKYLPGISLGEHIVASGDIKTVVDGADLIVLCVPHQYMVPVLKRMAGKIKPGAIAISLTKGMEVSPTQGPRLMSQMVRRILGIDCSVLMGANIAMDIANEQFSEAVIGYSAVENAEVFRRLLQRPYFKISLLPDPIGAEMCGTLKNVVALGAGMVDGLGLGSNSKASVIRQGLLEIRAFSKALFPQVREETFYECCGVGDLIATCYGGRNRLVAEEWTKRVVAGEPATFTALEAELLKGQKLQGTHTSDEVQAILRARGWESQYPLFTAINNIMHGRAHPSTILTSNEPQTQANNAPAAASQSPVMSTSDVRQ